MKANEFQIGDTVRYIGKNSPFLIGEIGTVEEKKKSIPGSVQVWWGERGNYGCYPYNLELISRKEPDWEI